MGGKNTKQASATEWDNHATLDQSSRIPYNTQVFQKYNTNIKALIDNLNPELSELSFTELLNNTLPYNTKYENVVDAQAPESAKPAPVMQNEALIDTFADSPFLSPIKYANLLNSITSENIQQGGAKNPKPKTGKKTDKKANKKPKSKYTEDKQSHEISECNGHKNCKRRNSDTSTEEPEEDEDSNKTTSDDNSDDEGKNSDDEAEKSDDEAEKSDESEEPDESAEQAVSGDSEEQHGKSNFNTKYQSDSSNNSVRTSEINMIGNDSY